MLKFNSLTDIFHGFLNFSKILFTKFWNYIFIALRFHSGSQGLLKEFLNLAVSAFQIELLCNAAKATSTSYTVHAAAIFFNKVIAISFTFLILFAVVANHHSHACSQGKSYTENHSLTRNKEVQFKVN